MNINFITMCGIIVCVALITAFGLAPVMWDAAGYIEDVLNHAFNTETY